MKKIEISLDGFEFEEVEESLARQLKGTDALVLRNKSESLEKFSLSPEGATIIVAGINIVAMVVNSLLVYLANKKSGQIVIKGSKGREIVIPKDTPDEKIQKLIELAQELDKEPKIFLRQ